MRGLAFVALVFFGAPPLLSGCASDPSEGYAFTSARSEQARTVAVPLFENRTYSHGIEQRLTEAIVKMINRQTSWRARPSGAETTLTGTVTGVDLRELATDRTTGLVQQMAIEITVDFEWRDNRTGEVLVSRRSFKGAGTFIPSQGVRERIEIGEQGAVEALARDIVNELRSDW
jgi:hypothetical protein